MWCHVIHVHVHALIHIHIHIYLDIQFIIIASDGVWEFISNQEAVDIVGAHSNPEEACKILVEEATKRWHQEEEVVDDITAVVVFL